MQEPNWFLRTKPRRQLRALGTLKTRLPPQSSRPASEGNDYRATSIRLLVPPAARSRILQEPPAPGSVPRQPLPVQAQPRPWEMEDGRRAMLCIIYTFDTACNWPIHSSSSATACRSQVDETAGRSPQRPRVWDLNQSSKFVHTHSDGDSLILIPKIDDFGDETVGGRILDFPKSKSGLDAACVQMCV